MQQTLQNIVSVLVIFVILPLTFFTGGGIHGGAPLWFVFCTLFVSMIVDGKIKYRNVFVLAWGDISLAEKDGRAQLVWNGEYHELTVEENRIVIKDLNP